MSAVEWGVVVSALVGVPTAVIAGLALQAQIRRDKADAEQALRQQIKDATDPIIADRDWYRQRVADLEEELRRRDRD